MKLIHKFDKKNPLNNDNKNCSSGIKQPTQLDNHLHITHIIHLSLVNIKQGKNYKGAN